MGNQVAAELDEEPPPIIKKPRGRKPKVKVAEAEVGKATIVAMVGITINSAFHMASLKFGEHWKLTDKETVLLSTSIDEAISTLPGESYVKIVEVLTKYAPFVALAYTAYGITAPRIAATKRAKRNSGASNSASQGVDNQESENVFGSWSTIADFDLGRPG